MKRQIAQITLAALAGAGLTYIALTTTPLRAQVMNRRFFQAQNSESDWVMPMHGQSGRGQGWGRAWSGSGPCPVYNGTYDSSSLETLDGQVTSIERVGPGQGTWLQMQTDQETMTVHLGPAWYLENQGAEIVVDDTIEVTGVRGMWGNETTIVASELTHADHTVTLRDGNGYPLWMNRN